MRRLRFIRVAPPGALTATRLTDFAWGVAGGAPELPMAGTFVGPLGAAFSAEELTADARWSRGELLVLIEEAVGRAGEEAVEASTESVSSVVMPSDGTTDRPAVGASNAPPDPPQGACDVGSPELSLRPSPSGSPGFVAVTSEAEWWSKHGRNWRLANGVVEIRGTGAPDPPAPALRPWAPASIAPLPPPDAASYVAQAEAQHLRGELDAAELSIGKALALDVTVPGGTERRVSIHAALERARRLVSPLEREARRRDAAELERTLAEHQSAWDSGRRLEAVRALRASLQTRRDGRVVERLLEAERLLDLGRHPRVRLDGEEVLVAFGAPAWLGRVDVAIEVPSPLISRHHLLFRRAAAGLVVVDRASANGTFAEGARLRDERLVESPLELRLGGEIPILVEPFGQGARVSVNGTVTLLVLGESLDWAGCQLSRIGDEAREVWRLEAPDGERIALGGVGVASLELARGDRVTVGSHVLELPLESA